MLESVCGILHPQHHMFRHAYNHLGGNVLKETDLMQAFESLVTIVQCCGTLVPYCPHGAPVRALCNLLGDAVSKTPIGLHECPTCHLSRRCAAVGGGWGRRLAAAVGGGCWRRLAAAVSAIARVVSALVEKHIAQHLLLGYV